MLGCRLVDLRDPRNSDQIKKLIVYVELDRCTADAVSFVSGVKLGRRSLKFADYGIMAATFLNLETGNAFRILSTEESRDLCEIYAPHLSEKHAQQMEAYVSMPDSVLFRVQKVKVDIQESDLPGPTRYKAVCSRCGQTVRDRREIVENGRVICKPCMGSAYFRDAEEITWQDMNWKPENIREFPLKIGTSPNPNRYQEENLSC